MAIFAISLLLVVNFLTIRVFLSESSEYSMYSVFAVNPAVSCKKIEPVKMNFPIIRVIPKENAEMHANLSDCPKYSESSPGYG